MITVQPMNDSAIKIFHRSSAGRRSGFTPIIDEQRKAEEMQLRSQARAMQPVLEQLRQQIEMETFGQRDAIRERVDADVWANEAKATPDKVAATLDEFTPRQHTPRHTDEFFTAEKRAQAKRELAMGGELN